MKPLFRLICFCVLLLAIPGESWARGSSSRGGSYGGGSRSSSSSSRGSSFGSSGSKSSGSSWGSSTRSSSSSGSSWGSSSRFSSSTSGSRSSSQNTSSATQRSGPTSSATDSALARKVGQGGAKFSSRSDAVSDFQQKYATKYPSTFNTPPTTRPSYIPQTTTINGGNYPVTYNSSYGGYGSMVGGRWTAYDVMRDTMMLNMLMGQHNYAYAGGGYGGRTNYYRSSSSSGGGVFVGLLFIIILVVVAIVVVKYLSSRQAVQANPFAGGGAVNSGAAAPPPLRNLKTSPMDKSKPEDWLAVKPNSVVTISDTQGIADSMKRGLGVRGIDYTVRSIGRLMQVDGLSTHLFLTLHDEEQVTYLLVKIVDDLIDLGLYFEVDTLQPGTRGELIDRGALWLFQEPQNPQHFDPADLRYTTTIRQTLPKAGGGDEEVVYDLKAQGEIQCNYTEQPPRSGMAGEALATIAEYRTAQAVENPEFLILEIGAQRSSTSYVQFFLGCPIKFSEVDVLPA